MPYVSARDLKQDTLFRAGESVSGVSGWNTQVLDYVNRVYTSLANGASEFLPEFVDDWWWMRSSGVLALLPAYDTGSVAVVNGSAAATLSGVSALSLAGYRLRVDGCPDVFVVQTHVAATDAITLDMPFTGDTSSAVAFKAMKVTYALNASVAGLISPMLAFRGEKQILGMTPERMDTLWPMSDIKAGAPSAFAMLSDQTVQFSHGGLDDGTTMRVEYRFRPSITLLEDSDASVPLVPVQYRHLLTDMALAYIMTDKNDDRAAAHAATAKSGLVAMVRENRRRLVKTSTEVATIRPRQNPSASRFNGPLRTESGLIIG